MRKDVPQEEANRLHPVPRAAFGGHRAGVHRKSAFDATRGPV